MAKRFTDSKKWADPWFRCLPVESKLFWIYLCDNCDEAGIWEQDFELFNFFSGTKVSPPVLINSINNGKQRITVKTDKIIINDFAKFQYGSFENSKHPFHKKLVSMINTVSDTVCDRVCHTLQDKDKDKDKDFKVFDFEKIYSKYPSKVGRKAAERYFKITVKSDVDFANIETALNNYIASERVQKGFVQNASTWFNNWSDWIKQPTVSQTYKCKKCGYECNANKNDKSAVEKGLCYSCFKL